MRTFQGRSTKSGAYVQEGPCPYQLYADIGRESLTAVLELDEDCPGQVFTYFMRGGIIDSRMTVDECRRGSIAIGELLEMAQAEWPDKMKPTA